MTPSRFVRTCSDASASPSGVPSGGGAGRHASAGRDQVQRRRVVRRQHPPPQASRRRRPRSAPVSTVAPAAAAATGRLAEPGRVAAGQPQRHCPAPRRTRRGRHPSPLDAPVTRIALSVELPDPWWRRPGSARACTHFLAAMPSSARPERAESGAMRITRSAAIGQERRSAGVRTGAGSCAWATGDPGSADRLGQIDTFSDMPHLDAAVQ